MIKKLRLKIALVILLIAAVLLGVIFLMIFRSTRHDLQSESRQMLQAIAAKPTDRPANVGEGIYLPYFTISLERSGLYMAIGSNQYDLENDAWLNEMMDIALESESPWGQIPQEALRYYRTERAGTRIMAFIDTAGEAATLASLARTLLILGLVSLLLVGVVAFFLSWLLAKPVDKAWKQQQQFVSDASHELKTPLTVILTNAELLHQQEEGQLSENILTMSHRMRTLVERLLDLTRADTGAMRQSFELLDLSRLTEEALLPFEPVYFERDLKLHTNIQPDITAKGSRQHLQQVAEILLDNAGKYAAAGTWVQVMLQRKNTDALLTVATPGPALTKQQQEDIFKRFYRVDESRTDGGSYGLGLSIAKSIVAQHRGHIWAESQNGVNIFRVSLPG